MVSPDIHPHSAPVWAVVPAKDLGEAKSRLAPALSPMQRKRLMLRLLRGTMAALAATPSLAGWLVISRDARLLDLGRQFGGQPVHESGHDLNSALRQARDAAVALGARTLLVIPGDLPLVTTAAIEGLLVAGKTSQRSVVLAPARDGRGTNALLLSPPDTLEFAFGVDSAVHHQEAAWRGGLPVLLHEAAEFALDLDTPDDLEAVAKLQGQWLGWVEDSPGSGPEWGISAVPVGV